MVEKYIIDKTDIHDLLTGKEIPLSQGKARAFCVEIAGKITNGDMIKAIFPNIDTEQIEDIIDVYGMSKCRVTYDTEWWNAPYKTENEEE